MSAVVSVCCHSSHHRFPHNLHTHRAGMYMYIYMLYNTCSCIYNSRACVEAGVREYLAMLR